MNPPVPRWTHVALRVRDIEASVAFYTSFAPLEVLDRRVDPEGHAAWLGQPDTADRPFILVLVQFFPGEDPYADVPTAALTPFAHLGIELPARADVDAVAARASAAGCLELGATELPPPVGYVCMVRDPDGNLVEFSHGQGVYAKAREVWGSGSG